MINIKKIGNKLVYLQLGIIILTGISEMAGLGRTIQYLSDINLLVLLIICPRSLFFNAIKRIKIPLIFIGLLLFEGILSFSYSNITFTQFIWEVRTLFRFPLFLVLCIAFLSPKDIFTLKDKADKLFYINFITSLIQYYIFNINGDYLGGVFGIQQGCNAASLFFLTIYITFIIEDYIKYRKNTQTTILKLILCFWIILYAEIKIMLITIIVIVIILTILHKKNKRTIIITSFTTICIFIFIALYAIIYQNNEMFTSKGMKDYTLNAYVTDDFKIGRSNAFETINRLFIDNQHHNRLLGLGMGYTSNSEKFALNGFHKKWGDTQYTNFLHSALYIENGYIGLTLYLLFWISFTYILYKRIKKSPRINSYYISAFVIAICTILTIPYNSGLKLPSAYFIYFILAIPFVYRNSHI